MYFSQVLQGQIYQIKDRKKEWEDNDGLIWYKLCSKQKSVILSNPLCKGSARKAIESYVNGKNFDFSTSSDSDSSSEF